MEGGTTMDPGQRRTVANVVTAAYLLMIGMCCIGVAWIMTADPQLAYHKSALLLGVSIAVGLLLGLVYVRFDSRHKAAGEASFPNTGPWVAPVISFLAVLIVYFGLRSWPWILAGILLALGATLLVLGASWMRLQSLNGGQQSDGDRPE